ncbi:MAG: hypothetical protein R3E87_15030 [Burkholderiaceae bacterium]
MHVEIRSHLALAERLPPIARKTAPWQPDEAILVGPHTLAYEPAIRQIERVYLPGGQVLSVADVYRIANRNRWAVRLPVKLRKPSRYYLPGAEA